MNPYSYAAYQARLPEPNEPIPYTLTPKAEASLDAPTADELAAMGPESVMTEPAPCCGYPEAEAGS